MTSGVSADLAVPASVLRTELDSVAQRLGLEETAREDSITGLTTRVTEAEGDIETLQEDLPVGGGLIEAHTVNAGAVNAPANVRLCKLRVWGAAGSGGTNQGQGNSGATYRVTGALTMSVPGAHGGVHDPLSGDSVLLRTRANSPLTSAFSPPIGGLALLNKGAEGVLGYRMGSTNGATL